MTTIKDFFWPKSNETHAIGPAILSGVLMALAAPGYGLWPLAWIGMIPVLMSLRYAKKAFLTGFVFGFVYHGVYMAWVFGLQPMSWLGFDPVTSLCVITLTWLVHSVWGSLLMGVVFWLYSLVVQKMPWEMACLIFPALWILGVCVFRETQWYIPWALVEHTQMPVYWLRMFAGVISGAGLAFVVLFHNAYWSLQPRKTYAMALPGLLILSFFLPTPVPPTLPLPVAAVQGNVFIGVVHSEAAMTPEFIAKVYLKPLQRESFKPGTLVVFPEEGVIADWVPLQSPRAQTQMRQFSEVADARKLSVITGLATFGYTPQQAFNSMAAITPDKPVQFYHKRQLVPFGEFSPSLYPGQKEPWLEELLKQASIDYSFVFSKGEDKIILLKIPGDKKMVKAGGLVCFELLYPELAKAYRHAGAQLLVNVSNLGWFHGNRLIEEQFLAAGQLRAAENRLPVVISANTGVSAIIAADGTVLQRAPSLERAVLYREK